MTSGVELIKRLSLAFGPSGAEEAVKAIIEEELGGSGALLESDKLGNLIARLPAGENAPRVLLSAHMDEVGFMVTEIGDDGFLRFANLGGIDPAVMVGRAVVLGEEDKRVAGVIACKGIHFQSAEERAKAPTAKDMYIDIGATSKEEAEKLVCLGTFGTFDTDFVLLGKDDAYLSGKALDDRVGCALLIELVRELADKHLPLDLYFCFTVREELGISGATVTANRVGADIGVVIETTAIADLPTVPEARRVARVGKGGVLSLLDRTTIYDRELVDLALAVGKNENIPVQIKRFVSGGNDGDEIQQSGTGVRCMALSLPTRYLHAPVSVAAVRDYISMKELLRHFLLKVSEREDLVCIKH